MALGQLRLGRDHAQLLLPGEGLFPQLVPALVELALVLRRPLRRHVVRGVGRPRREVHEEGLVGHERLLPAHPLDGVVGQVLGEVIALFGGLVQLDRRGAFVERGVVLVGLGADEAVEVLEAAAGRPGVVRAGGAGLPTRHFVALAELGGGVAVQLERLGQRGAGLGADRAVAGRRGGHLGDAAHADRVVVAPGQQRLARRRAQRGGVEAVVLQPVRRQPLGGRRVARAAEGGRGAEAHVVDQDDQHVGRALGRAQRLDRRILRIRVLGVVGRQPDMRDVGDGEDLPLDLVLGAHCVFLSSFVCS